MGSAAWPGRGAEGCTGLVQTPCPFTSGQGETEALGGQSTNAPRDSETRFLRERWMETGDRGVLEQGTRSGGGVA